MRHRFTKSRAGRVMLGAVLAGALSGAGASIARATLSLDIEAGSGTPAAPVNTVTVAPGSTTNFTVYAEVTGTTSSLGLGGLFAAFDASSTTAGSLGSLTASTPANPFDYTSGVTPIASAGTTYSAFSDGTYTHVGTGPYNGAASSSLATDFNSATPTGWFFAAYLTNTGGNISSIDTTVGGTFSPAGGGTGAYFPIGTLSFVAGSSTGTATVTGVGRTQVSNSMVAALWDQDGATSTPATGAAITSDSLTVTIGSAAHAGDTAPQDGHTVGVTDLTNVLNNLGTYNAAGYAYPDTPTNDSNPVGVTDLTLVLNNLGLGNSSIIAAPEPSSLGLLGLGAMAFVRRRNRK
jgi:hypothetical protein